VKLTEEQMRWMKALHFIQTKTIARRVDTLEPGERQLIKEGYWEVVETKKNRQGRMISMIRLTQKGREELMLPDLIEAIKNGHVKYCKRVRRFIVPTKEHLAEVTSTITEHCTVCERAACLHQPVCRIVDLSEGMKEDLLAFYRVWDRLERIERSLTTGGS